MITRKVLENWRSLQIEVGQILTECKFTVEVEKKIKSPRGGVEIDVFAEECVHGRKYVIACECKFWRKSIPQTVIHSFRTVVQEVGANIGYVISKEGFQSGAFSASEFTNIKLVTWEEFQANFETCWLEEHFSKKIDERLHPLMTYSEPFLPRWFELMSEGDKKAYITLKEKYDFFGMLMQSLGPYSRQITKEPFPSLPIIDWLKPDPIIETIPNEILSETGYKEFLNLAIEYGEAATSEFRKLKDKYAT